MLIRNKTNFNLSAVEFTGNWLGSIDYIKESTWMNQPFDSYAGVPDGYVSKSLVMPYKTGRVSGLTENISTSVANGNNGNSQSVSDLTATLGGLVGLAGNISALSTLSGALNAIANADGSITIFSSVSGDIVSVLNGIGASIALATVNGDIIGAVNGVGETSVAITIFADMVGIFGSEVALSASSTLGIATLDGKANAIIGLVGSANITATLLARGYMSGSTEDTSVGLTAKDVWEYYQRTLTSGGADSFTLAQIADAVWAKAIP